MLLHTKLCTAKERAIAAVMAKDSAREESLETTTSLFPVFHQSTTPTTSIPNLNENNNNNSRGPTGWLCNTSFTTDLSIMNDGVASHYDNIQPNEKELEEEEITITKNEKQSVYELLESSSSDEEKKEKKRKRRGKKRPTEPYGLSSRKHNVHYWATTSSSDTKEYYFDSCGDRDNLAFGCLYRMDVARYKLYHTSKSSGLNYNMLNQRSWAFEGDDDVNSLDNKLKTQGRYWSAKYIALEHHRNFKRIRIVAHKEFFGNVAADFIPLSDDQISSEGEVLSRASLVEESWEDEMLRKTREFNKMSREQPFNEKVWLDFAEFQDKVASMQPQRGARLQILEKKISILEKATELNPDNEELLLGLMNSYQSRDGNDVLIDRWEKLLMQHSGSYKLWREFLRLVQGDFSRFKVSKIRNMYAKAIGALSATCNRQHRQLYQTSTAPSPDPGLVQQELGLVDLFISLCRFEWQAGYRELATALLQAEIEYSLFYPSLLLSKQGKIRLFEHFWNSTGARIGEDGALGWSTWLEKEEEQRQKVMIKETSGDFDEGGWTGWFEPKSKDIAENREDIADDNVDTTKFEDGSGIGGMDPNDDTEALLKMLGINADGEPDGEVKDSSTWFRWAEEELSRDSDQWMPIRTESGISPTDGTADREGDEELLRVILFEDVSEYLFSLTSEEARLSLVYQLIDFYGGRLSQWLSTNSSGWAETTLTIEALPESILDDLRRIHDLLTKADSSKSSFSLEHVLGSSDNISMMSGMMKFLRNATLLCLNAFPRDYILKEAVLVAEELSNTRMNSCSYSVTPCRALAKSLLKCNRQDVHLCGVYARREAVFGNIDHARKVFDMALSSIEGLPWDSQSNVSLLVFWYAETELASSSCGNSESLSRAMHILSCLGSGIKYSSFKSQPSSFQLLRARQGFKERIRMIQATWMRGVIDDNSIALICSAALFEELTTGWEAGIEVLNQAFTIVLPERRSRTYQLEFLFNFYVSMLWKHHSQLKLAKVWDSVVQGLEIYPFSPKLYNAFVQIGHLHTSPSKMRWIIDDYLHKKPSVILCLFALSYELSKGGSHHRVHGIFERALANIMLRNSVVLWRLYMSYEMNVAGNLSAARRIFFRAIHACPWSKRLWLDGFLKLNSVLTTKELSDLLEVMRDKELNLRTDVYEILLQDEMES